MSSQAVVKQENKPDTLQSLLEKSRGQIAMALPTHMTPERMIRTALTAVRKTPDLQLCTPISIVGCIIEASQLGLEPDGVLGSCYMVPFNNKKTRRKEAQLIVGYRGLIQLARRSGQVVSISAHVVYEKDHFDFVYGLEERLDHRPLMSGERGDPVAVYAIAQLKDGGRAFEVMSFDQIEEIRKTSKAGDSGPWKDYWEEMARKTAVRRLAKYLPLSPEFMKAAVLDEYATAGVSQDMAAVINAEAAEVTENRAEELKARLEAARKQEETPDAEPDESQEPADSQTGESIEPRGQEAESELNYGDDDIRF